MASVDSWIRVGQAGVTRLHEQRRNETQKGPRLPGNAHETKGEEWADLPAFQQSRAWVFYRNLSPQRYNVRYAEREKGKEIKRSKEWVLLAASRGVICEGKPVIR